MRSTKTITGAEARQKVLQGVNTIYHPVSLTLGPEGKNALLYRTFNRGNRITNDGVTVAECQVPKDQFVRLAAEAFKEGCKRTNERVGDGTTTTAVIGGALFNQATKLLTDSENQFTEQKTIGVMTLRKKILETGALVKQQIKQAAKKIEKLEQLEKVASISVEDQELGKIIANVAWEVGVDGFIDVVEGYKGEVETEVIRGMRFPAKVPAKAFVNNPARYEMVAEDCHVLITNYSLNNASELADALKELGKTTSKLIIVAPQFSENVLVNMVNATKNGYFMFPVHTPSLRTEQFDDLAIYCGATFVDKQKGKSLQSIRPADLGFLEKLVVKDAEAREDAVAVGGKGTREEIVVDITTETDQSGKKRKVENQRVTTKITERISILRKQIEETQQDIHKKLLQRRIGSMSSAIGIIRVGDTTQASALYRKLKVEDAAYACKAALRAGYVSGGGLCLKQIADTLADDDIVKQAILAPYQTIQASVDGGIEITDNIIDPMEAVYYAVEHAIGVVSNLITVEIITPELEDPIHGEGEFAIAKAINRMVLSQKAHYGQIKSSELAVEEGLLGGLTVDEIVYSDNG